MSLVFVGGEGDFFSVMLGCAIGVGVGGLLESPIKGGSRKFVRFFF